MNKQRIFLVIFLFAIISAIFLGYIFVKNSSSVLIGLENKSKIAVKKVVRKVSNFIYREAEIYNPPGDVLPDSIDDTLKKEIKNIQ